MPVNAAGMCAGWMRRVRPSELDHSYAFPSGHTTAAVFFLGALLYIILPLCVAGAAPLCDSSSTGVLLLVVPASCGKADDS